MCVCYLVSNSFSVNASSEYFFLLLLCMSGLTLACLVVTRCPIFAHQVAPALNAAARFLLMNLINRNLFVVVVVLLNKLKPRFAEK